jgi:hypothetical protein
MKGWQESGLPRERLRRTVKGNKPGDFTQRINNISQITEYRHAGILSFLIFPGVVQAVRRYISD